MNSPVQVDPRAIIRENVEESIRVTSMVLRTQIEVLSEIAAAIITCYQQGGKLVLFGNGGSAADAQHVAGEFVNRFQSERAALPALALSSDAAVMTSIANDRSYDEVFSRQVEALVAPGDVVAGISTSGRSANVLRGLEAARRKGALTIGFTGQDGTPLMALSALCFAAPTNNTARIQEAHMLAWHSICDAVDEALG